MSIMNGTGMRGRRGQTTIEYLLLIAVVVILFVAVLSTVNALRQEAGKSVNVSGKEETPTEAIGTQLGKLRDIATAPPDTGAPSKRLTVTISDELPCRQLPFSIGATNEDGPVVGATITLSNGTAVVDSKPTLADGKNVFVPQQMGTYIATASAPGNEPGSKQFTVAC